MKSSLLLALLASASVSLVSAAVDCTRRTKCLSVYTPVCGSDGHTYANQCDLDNAICLAAAPPHPKTLTKLFDGACDMSPNPFCGARCSNMTRVPVCGSNGLTYSNPCLLNEARCTNVTLTIAYDGACKPKPTPTPTPKACNDVCPMMFNPVCGSDGVTYSNACLVGVAACEDTSLDLTVAYGGPCNVESTTPPSRCIKGCPKMERPVCGSDNKTYSNQCLLDNAACAAKTLKKVYDGKCKATVAPSACAAILCAPFTECKVDAASKRAYCADVCTPQRCAAGEVCMLKQVQCFTTPCPPVATCTKRT